MVCDKRFLYAVSGGQDSMTAMSLIATQLKRSRFNSSFLSISFQSHFKNESGQFSNLVSTARVKDWKQRFGSNGLGAGAGSGGRILAIGIWGQGLIGIKMQQSKVVDFTAGAVNCRVLQAKPTGFSGLTVGFPQRSQLVFRDWQLIAAPNETKWKNCLPQKNQLSNCNYYGCFYYDHGRKLRAISTLATTETPLVEPLVERRDRFPQSLNSQKGIQPQKIKHEYNTQSYSSFRLIFRKKTTLCTYFPFAFKEFWKQIWKIGCFHPTIYWQWDSKQPNKVNGNPSIVFAKKSLLSNQYLQNSTSRLQNLSYSDVFHKSNCMKKVRANWDQPFAVRKTSVAVNISFYQAVSQNILKKVETPFFWEQSTSSNNKSKLHDFTAGAVNCRVPLVKPTGFSRLAVDGFQQSQLVFRDWQLAAPNKAKSKALFFHQSGALCCSKWLPSSAFSQIQKRWLPHVFTCTPLSTHTHTYSQKWHKQSSNNEDKSRNARYSAFMQIALKHNFSTLTVLHTAADRTENVFANLFKGSSPWFIFGLTRSIIVRPFLWLSRWETKYLCAKYKLPIHIDKTNGLMLMGSDTEKSAPILGKEVCEHSTVSGNQLLCKQKQGFGNKSMRAKVRGNLPISRYVYDPSGKSHLPGTGKLIPFSPKKGVLVTSGFQPNITKVNYRQKSVSLVWFLKKTKKPTTDKAFYLFNLRQSNERNVLRYLLLPFIQFTMFTRSEIQNQRSQLFTIGSRSDLASPWLNFIKQVSKKTNKKNSALIQQTSSMLTLEKSIARYSSVLSYDCDYYIKVIKSITKLNFYLSYSYIIRVFIKTLLLHEFVNA